MPDLSDLERALYDEHCYNCSDNSCDIYVAYEHGLYLWAAHSLIGATECPKTEAAYVALGEWADRQAERDRQKLVELDNYQCERCGATCYEVEEYDSCSNCQHPFFNNAELRATLEWGRDE